MKRSSPARILVLSFLGLVVIAIAGERLLSLWLERRLDQWAGSRNISIGSMTLSVVGRSVRVRDVRWPSHPQNDVRSDSAHFHLEKLSITGIELFRLIRDKKIVVRALVAENGEIFVPARKDSNVVAVDSIKSFGGFQAASLRVINTAIMYKPDSATTWSALANLTLEHIELRDVANPTLIASYQLDGADLTLAKVSRKQTGGFYSLGISRIDFDRGKHTLSCDSVSFIPSYPKLEFAHKRGTQSTWANVQIPRIEVQGLDFKQHADSTLTASYVLVKDARVDAFRDRRVPLRRKSEVPLPMKWLRELHLALEIDSLEVANMDLVYEHVSEEGFEPGKLRLSHLEGMFTNINNRGYDNLPRVTTLVASAMVMDRAKLEAQFTFPLEPGALYTAKGRLRDLQLKALNPMLENAAFVSVESGYLKDLTFQFRYNNDESRGDVNIEYHDLKVKGLHKNAEGDVDKFKTLIANTALKNNNSRSGAILIERDKRRFIFHFWATSLMDGIRSAVVPAAPDRKSK